MNQPAQCKQKDLLLIRGSGGLEIEKVPKSRRSSLQQAEKLLEIRLPGRRSRLGVDIHRSRFAIWELQSKDGGGAAVPEPSAEILRRRAGVAWEPGIRQSMVGVEAVVVYEPVEGIIRTQTSEQRTRNHHRSPEQKGQKVQRPDQA